MAKEKRRGNREIRKPKQKKEAVAAPVGLSKGISASIAVMKKKS